MESRLKKMRSENIEYEINGKTGQKIKKDNKKMNKEEGSKWKEKGEAGEKGKDR